MSSAASTTDPLSQCDLVMKGGITSGVVYPAAVLVLKEKFRFRSIGGASAGAIAAALTAAAEMGREHGGFDKLEQARQEILTEGFLGGLFRAKGRTGPLLDAIVQLTTISSKTRQALTALWLLLRKFPVAALIGAAAGAIGGLLIAWILAQLFQTPWPIGSLLMAPPRAGIVFAVLGLIIGAFVGPLISIAQIVFSYLPHRGYFGLCPGFIKDDNRVLTNWLYDRIEQLSGPHGAGPLTFAHLSGKTPPAGTVTNEKDADWGISLRMMTSNLSHGQPYVFPRPGSDGKTFVFSAKEFSELFPKEVVDYMTSYWSTRPADPDADPTADTKRHITFADDDLHFLPAGDDLPVIVATRMSLSFPVLLSAVPLYTIKPTALRDFARGTVNAIGLEHLQRNWISDGGISSNFPIHFFDSFLPSRPTFGMNLNYLPKDFKKTAQSELDPDAFSETDPHTRRGDADFAQPLPDVILPPLKMARYARPHWQPITELVSFLGAIFSTAKNYRDNMQMLLPSYRDRTVQIWLTADEGGMNLAMPSDTIKRIDDKGELAGKLLREMNFREHQWVRLRVLLAALEPQMRKMWHNFPTADAYASLLDDQLCADPTWYKQQGAAWCADANERLALLAQFLNAWKAVEPLFDRPNIDASPGLFADDPPDPKGVLRVTPDV